MAIIALDCRMYGHSGIGAYLRNILASSALFEPRDVRYRLLGDADALAEVGRSQSAGTEIAPCRSPIYSVAEQFELVRLSRRDVDLFWSPHYNVPVFLPKKLVVTIHDVNHLAMSHMLDSYVKRRYARVMFSAIRKKATRIICDSAFTADELARHAGADMRKVRVVHLGVDRFWRELACSRPEEAPYFLYVGNLKPHKNLPRLIEAFKSIAPRIPQRLVIVGKAEGFITPDRAVLSAAMRLDDRIKFTGVIDDGALRAYFNHADALVLPSLYEGFGLPPLEAMACGCPTLVSSAASLPEICGTGSRFFDPFAIESIAAALLQAALDPDLRDELRQRGREWVKRYDWEICASATRSILDEALAL